MTIRKENQKNQGTVLCLTQKPSPVLFRNTRYYEWDNLHNEIEVFNKQGRHLGAMDPTTGEMIKDAVPGRTIDI